MVAGALALSENEWKGDQVLKPELLGWGSRGVALARAPKYVGAVLGRETQELPSGSARSNSTVSELFK
jgi:hypothetical protein